VNVDVNTKSRIVDPLRVFVSICSGEYSINEALGEGHLEVHSRYNK
jgi:hypothetical protein